MILLYSLSPMMVQRVRAVSRRYPHLSTAGGILPSRNDGSSIAECSWRCLLSHHPRPQSLIRVVTRHSQDISWRCTLHNFHLRRWFSFPGGNFRLCHTLVTIVQPVFFHSRLSAVCLPYSILSSFWWWFPQSSFPVWFFSLSGSIQCLKPFCALHKRDFESTAFESAFWDSYFGQPTNESQMFWWKISHLT